MLLQAPFRAHIMHTGFPALVGTESCLPPIMALMLVCPHAAYLLEVLIDMRGLILQD